jgi:membrane protein CcdC involved in cytochrome C biogenesis
MYVRIKRLGRRKQIPPLSAMYQGVDAVTMIMKWRSLMFMKYRN